MKSVARDTVGVLSAKNTVSKYWGVSKTKNKSSFTVRFMEKDNKELITFKPKSELSEELCARIAARFYDDESLYATSPGSIEMIFPEGVAEVNTCSNTINFVAAVTQEQTVIGTSNWAERVGSAVEKLTTIPATVEKKVKAKTEKVVDHFGNRVKAIMLEALNSAKAKLATQNAVYL